MFFWRICWRTVIIITYPDMKILHRSQVVDLRHQVDQITPEKFQLLEEVRADPANARKLVILIRQRQFKMVSDGSDITEIKFN